MNNFIKYPQGGNIDTTSMLTKDNLVSISGLYPTLGPDGRTIVTKDLLNHDNNFNNIENKDTEEPNIFEIKFKDISILIRYDEIIMINRNIQISCRADDVNNCAEINIDIIDLADPAIQTNIVTGKYYFTLNQVRVDPGTN